MEPKSITIVYDKDAKPGERAKAAVALLSHAIDAFTTIQPEEAAGLDALLFRVFGSASKSEQSVVAAAVMHRLSVNHSSHADNIVFPIDLRFSEGSEAKERVGALVKEGKVLPLERA